uniref:Glycosyltransferase n=1 Tax=viral metagenome TaxID=1070528 RepID=A0A6C0I7J6_9ZZZZ
MHENIKDIANLYPNWKVYIYHGDIDIEPFQSYSNVVLIKGKYTDAHLMLDRFVAIDSPDVEIMMVRDADSRINVRDQWCIQQFLVSPHKFHIIRDHPHHRWFILGGLWGIKKGCIPHFSLRRAIDIYRSENKNRSGYDQYFLKDVVYPKINTTSLIHGQITLKGEEHAIPIPLKHNGIFCGQIIEYSADGTTYVDKEHCRLLLQ